MRYRILHRSHYRYGTPVDAGFSEACLLLRPADGQEVLASQLFVEPEPTSVEHGEDLFGNRITAFVLGEAHTELVVEARADVRVARPVAPAGGGPAWDDRDALLAAAGPEGGRYLLDSPLAATDPALAGYAFETFGPGRPLLDGLDELTARIHADCAYLPGTSDTATTAADVLQRRSGVCQDFAHLAIACLRSIGLPARYVSGYLETDPPPGQVKLQGSDASHAWFAAFVPGVGWVDLDPTNDQRVGDRHITLAWGRDYQDVAPLRGVAVGAAGQSLEVGVDVERVDDASPVVDPPVGTPAPVA